MKRNPTYTAELGEDPVGNETRIKNALKGMENKIEAHKIRLATLEHEMENTQTGVEQPFPKEDELREKSTRLTLLNWGLEKPRRKKEEMSQAEGGPRDAYRPFQRSR